MNRDDMIRRAFDPGAQWDIIVIGGGATGAGVAIDAASRGYRTLLAEQHDFGKGTSGRSTKLIHGGVRYLGQGNIALVMEALRERGLLHQNAPHLVRNLAFIVPAYSWWESPFYGAGLKLYSAFAGKYRFGHTHLLSREETLQRLPTIKTDGLKGGVVYHDGQFDDARLLISLIATAADHGATLANYLRITALSRGPDGLIDGVHLRDEETGREARAAARVVVNAAGPFCDAIRRMAEPEAPTLIAPSQGVHLVFDRSFLPGDSAIMVPHTRDGRVMFAIPWNGRTLVGTTDVPLDEAPLEPTATEAEIDLILETAARYLDHPPTRADILSVFAGIRPLVRAGEAKDTASLSRDHTIHIDPSGLLTITGGKWTTYRNMAEDAVDQAATLADLEEHPCATKTLRIHGYHEHPEELGELSEYGADAPAILELARLDPSLAQPLHPSLPYTAAEIVWSARHEMSRTVEDALARRTRALFLDARAAREAAPAAARLLAHELGRDEVWQSAQIRDFTNLAQQYLPSQ